MNKPLEHFYVILLNLQNYGYFYSLPRKTKTIEIFQISIFIESAPICGQPIIKLTFKPWFVSVCVDVCFVNVRSILRFMQQKNSYKIGLENVVLTKLGVYPKYANHDPL